MAGRNSHIRSCLLVFLLLCFSLPAFAAAKQPALARRGLAVGLQVTKTSDWALVRAEIPAASGFGLRVSYGIGRYFAPHFALNIILYGSELSGFSIYTWGFETRLSFLGPLVPYLSAGLGRIQESGGVSFTHAEVGGGARMFLSDRFAVDVDLVLITSISAGSSDRSTNRTPLIRDGHFRRFRFGISWHFGQVDK